MVIIININSLDPYLVTFKPAINYIIQFRIATVTGNHIHEKHYNFQKTIYHRSPVIEITLNTDIQNLSQMLIYVINY